MRVILAGGGSGGHLFPGIAIAREFIRRSPDVEIMFIGSEKGIESRVIPREGFNIILLKTEGVLGKSLGGKIVALWRMGAAVMASMAIYNNARPDVVVGLGGYVSVAPVLAASIKKVPTLIVEQNLVPGMATRFLAKFANRIGVTHHETQSVLPRFKTQLTGNPIRAEIMRGKRDAAVELFKLEAHKQTVLVVGGSQGAHRINEAMLDALNEMLDIRDGIQFLHQSGEKDYEKVRKTYRKMGYTAMVAPFIHQMPEAYAIADVVVSRAGATTIAELTALGKASILIPYPLAAGHQEMNARKLLDVGGCRMVEEHELDGSSLSRVIRELYGSEEIRGKMRVQARTIGRADAAQRVVDLAESLVRARSRNV